MIAPVSASSRWATCNIMVASAAAVTAQTTSLTCLETWSLSKLQYTLSRPAVFLLVASHRSHNLTCIRAPRVTHLRSSTLHSAHMGRAVPKLTLPRTHATKTGCLFAVLITIFSKLRDTTGRHPQCVSHSNANHLRMATV